MTKAKKARRYCIAHGCLNNDGMDGFAFFKLPMDTHRCRIWLEALDREDIAEKALLRPHSYSVCCAHFKDASFKKSLKNNAVPVEVYSTGSPEDSLHSESESVEVCADRSPESSVDRHQETSTSTHNRTEEPKKQNRRARVVCTGTQTEPPLTTDRTPQNRDLLEESRIAQYKYVRNFIRKKGLRQKNNILLSHRCTDDDICKNICKLIDYKKKP